MTTGAWHDLIDRDENPTEELIVEHTGTKKHWHESKEKIPKEKLYEAIVWLEANNLVPDGRGKLTLKAKNSG